MAAGQVILNLLRAPTENAHKEVIDRIDAEPGDCRVRTGHMHK